MTLLTKTNHCASLLSVLARHLLFLANHVSYKVSCCIPIGGTYPPAKPMEEQFKQVKVNSHINHEACIYTKT